jgi:hypothetical protein
VAAGGVITFNCGPRPVTIAMEATAEVHNTSRRVVLDGGGMVALSGGGARRILYMNTCDQALGTATSDCFNQQWPRLIVQNMTFRTATPPPSRPTTTSAAPAAAAPSSTSAASSRSSTRRFIATAASDRPRPRRRRDPGAGPVGNRPVYITSDTFRGGACSNGGALSSIGVSWVVLNSVMTHNQAIGQAPTRPGPAPPAAAAAAPSTPTATSTP